MVYPPTGSRPRQGDEHPAYALLWSMVQLRIQQDKFTSDRSSTAEVLPISGVTMGWLLRLVTGAPLVVGAPTVLEFLVINFRP